MEQKFDSKLGLSHFEPGLIHPNHGVFVMSDEIEEQWDIPSLDDFSLGIAESVRARCARVPASLPGRELGVAVANAVF